MARDIITITDIAKTKIVDSVRARINAVGILIGINKKGCSGNGYVLEYCEKSYPAFDKIKLEDDVSIFIDTKALLFLIGMEIDWRKDTLKEGFVFENPNAKGMCGCGESFHV